MSEVVDREALEAQLADLSSRSDPVLGLFGPGTMVWKLGRESTVVLGGGRAALMQVAHPYVAHGVARHSEVFQDVQARFQRTLSTMYGLVFSTPDDAFRLSRRLHGIHTQVTGAIEEDVGRFRQGDRYRANEVDALFWVAATLWDTTVLLYERCVGRLTMAEKDAYYAGARTVCRLFGIPQSAMPADWAGFRRYMGEMLDSSTIAVGEAARSIATAVFTPPRPAARPMFAWIQLLTAGFLPDRLRQDFGLRFGPAERLAFEASLRAFSKGLHVLPPQLRYVPAYVNARRRIAGRSQPDPVSDGFSRAVLALLEAR